MPITPASVVAVRRAAAIAAKLKGRKMGSMRVLTVEKAISCCEKNESAVLSRINDIINGLISGLSTMKKGESLALVPGAALTTSPLIKVLSAPEVAAIDVTPGVLVLGAYAVLAPLIESRVAYETLALVAEAFGGFVSVRTNTSRQAKSCYLCMWENALSQKHPRKRQKKVNILRRL